MQWDWSKIWNDGWIFYATTLVIFLIGLVYEVFTLYKANRKSQELIKNLKFLEDNKTKGISLKGWFREHLLSEKVDPIDRKFRLQQYPREIAVIPRSSLRFIPPILTAIGVLGTFWGMSFGLMGVTINANDVNQSLNSAITLIDGMKTAFFTSLLTVR